MIALNPERDSPEPWTSPGLDQGELKSGCSATVAGAAWALVATHLSGDGDVHAVLDAARDALD